jgi:hypothetical protein
MPFKQAVDALKGEVDRLKLEIQTLQTRHGVAGNITIGDYILTRLAQLGVTVRLRCPLHCILRGADDGRRKCLGCLVISIWDFW